MVTKNLKIVTISPLVRTVLAKDLTYFTTKDIGLGSLVQISIKKKKVPGIVTSIVEEAADLKSDLKTSSFAFKKIEKVLAKNVFLEEFIAAAKDTAEYFISSLGQIIKVLTPKVILDDWQKQGPNNFLEDKESAPLDMKGKAKTISLLGGFDEERYSLYKSIIREEFAKKHSVVFILPTIHDVEDRSEILNKGIEEYTITLHGKQSPKIIRENWQRALKEKHPILLIATPVFLSLPRKDVGVIILDGANSDQYKTVRKPFIDVRTFVKKFVAKRSIRAIFGDSVPNLEEIHKIEDGTYIEESPLKYRFIKNVEQEVIDMRKLGEEEAIISGKIKNILRESLTNKKNVLLIALRRGLGTKTVCGDCGEIIICVNCALPMTLYKNPKENFYSCNHCDYKTSSEIKCAKCGGWRLRVFGISTEKIEEELNNAFPKNKIIRFDGNTVKNYKKGQDLISEFNNNPGSILVATEMVLSYLNQEVPTIGILSIDSLFAIPDFKINENIFNLLIRLKIKASERFIIQTRRPEEKIFEYILRGDLLEFYRNEMKERRSFGYPPFKILIKITAEGSKETVTKEMLQLEKYLKPYEPKRFEAFLKRTKNKERINLLLRVNPEDWPPAKDSSGKDNEAELKEILSSLPSRFAVRVDPDNLL